MAKWKKKFEVLYEKFGKKKPTFAAKIDAWQKSGRRTLHKKGKALFDALEKEGQELKELLSDTGAAISHAAGRSRVRRFKKMYKQLHESTKPVWRQWIEALLVAGFIALLLRNFLFGLYHVPTGSAEPTILVGDRVWGNKLAYYVSKVKRGDLVIFDNPQHKFDKSSKLRYMWEKYIGLPVPLLGLRSGPINMVKRVIAVPGDLIEGRIEDGKTVVYINGKKMEESYVNTYPLIWVRKETGFIPFESIGPLQVPAFLQRRPVPNGVWYTYDPDKPFEKQPYYHMEESEVIQIPGYPFIRKPFSPSYKGFERMHSVDVYGPMRVPEGKYWVMGDSRKNSQDSRWFGFLDESLIHGRLSFIIYSVDSQEPFWLFELIKHPIDFWFKYIRWNRFFTWPK